MSILNRKSSSFNQDLNTFNDVIFNTITTDNLISNNNNDFTNSTIDFTNATVIGLPASGGDVSSSINSTNDKSLAIFDGTSGKLIKDSSINTTDFGINFSDNVYINTTNNRQDIVFGGYIDTTIFEIVKTSDIGLAVYYLTNDFGNFKLYKSKSSPAPGTSLDPINDFDVIFRVPNGGIFEIIEACKFSNDLDLSGIDINFSTCLSNFNNSNSTFDNAIINFNNSSSTFDNATVDFTNATLIGLPSGDVSSSVNSTTDNSIVLFDGITGKLIKNSSVTITSGNIIAGAIIAINGLSALGRLIINTSLTMSAGSVIGAANLSSIDFSGSPLNSSNTTIDFTNSTVNFTNATINGVDFVDGPASSTNNSLAIFDGTTGKLIKDSNFTATDFGINLNGIIDIAFQQTINNSFRQDIILGGSFIAPGDISTIIKENDINYSIYWLSSNLGNFTLYKSLQNLNPGNTDTTTDYEKVYEITDDSLFTVFSDTIFDNNVEINTDLRVFNSLNSFNINDFSNSTTDFTNTILTANNDVLNANTEFLTLNNSNEINITTIEKMRGSIFFNTPIDVIIPALNQYSSFNVTYIDEPGVNAGVLNNGNFTITTSNPGICKLECSISYLGTNKDDSLYEFSIFKNGILIPSSVQKAGADDKLYKNTTLNCIQSYSNGDTFDLRIQCIDKLRNLTISNCNFTITKID